jgi:hypothetical protein
MSSDDDDRGRERPLDRREERLAAALRANLRRRKAQARARRAPGDDDASSGHGPGAGGNET